MLSYGASRMDEDCTVPPTAPALALARTDRGDQTRLTTLCGSMDSPALPRAWLFRVKLRLGAAALRAALVTCVQWAAHLV
jgi:hypothetical protein